MKRCFWLWLLLVLLLQPGILWAQSKKPDRRAPVQPSGQTDKILKFGPKDEGRVQFTTEMRFSQPTRFALVRDTETGQVNLHKADDPIFLGRNPLPVGRILRVDDASLVFAPLGGQPKEVRKGNNIPPSKRLVFLGSVILEKLRFQVRYGNSQPAPTVGYSVVEIARRQATLQRDALPGESQFAAASPTGAQPLQAQARVSDRSGAAMAKDAALVSLVNSIPIREVGQNTWEVSTQDVKDASSALGQVLAEALSSARPSLTPWYGLAVTVDTSAGAGTLDRRGFLVEDPRLASRMGLEMGDRILFVNQQPVNSVGGLYRIYTNLQSDAGASEVKVLINRENAVQTLTYRLR